MPQDSLQTLTTDEAFASGLVIGFTSMLVITIVLLVIISTWKILEKAGEKGWKALIPIYNVYLLYKIVGMKKWFWITLLTSFLGSIICTANGFNPNGMTIKQIENYDFGAHSIVIVALSVMAIIGLIANIIYASRTAKAFGRSALFAIGLFFFPNLFWLILGLGSSKYNKKAVKEA